MKGITVFLLLSLVVLMAEPGDAVIHHIFRVGRCIYRCMKGHGAEDVVLEQVAKRSVDADPGQPGFA